MIYLCGVNRRKKKKKKMRVVLFLVVTECFFLMLIYGRKLACDVTLMMSLYFICSTTRTF